MAGDEGGAQGNVGNEIAHARHDLAVFLRRSGTAHFCEDVRGDMLQRNIAVRHEALLAAHQLEQRPVERSGIGIQKADPRKVGLIEERLHELRQPVRQPEVRAVARGVLGNEAQFFDALLLQRLRFADQRFDRSRTELAAHLRNRAERARIRASFRDFQICVPAAVRQDARQIFVQPHRHLSLRWRRVDVAADCLRDGFEMIESDERIDLRNRLLQIASVLLHHAACDDQPLDAFVFALGDFEDRID